MAARESYASDRRQSVDTDGQRNCSQLLRLQKYAIRLWRMVRAR